MGCSSSCAPAMQAPPAPRPRKRRRSRSRRAITPYSRMSLRVSRPRQEGKVRFSVEDEHVAPVIDRKALRRDVTKRALALDRIVTFGSPIQNIDMSAIGVELVATVLVKQNVAIKIQELRLRLIGPGIARELDPIAAIGRQIRFWSIERDEIGVARDL